MDHRATRNLAPPEFSSSVKTFLQVSAVTLFLAAWILYGLWEDYSWSARTMRDKNNTALALAATQDDLLSITRVWTWFKQPITGIWLVNSNKAIHASGLTIVPIRHLAYEYPETSASDYLEAIDPRARKSAILPDRLDTEKVLSGQLEWNAYPKDTPGDQILSYVVSQTWAICGATSSPPHPATSCAHPPSLPR